MNKLYEKILLDEANKYMILQKEDIDKEAIELKIKHTYRVVENMLRIANKLNFDENELKVSETIAFFHDLGRFKQYNDYKTFADKNTVNHGELSSKLLQEKSILDEFSIEDKNLILKSISLHNAYTLPETLTKRELLFLDIIRDADRIDIFNCVSNIHPFVEESDIHIWYPFGSKESYVSDSIYDMVMNKCKSPSHDDVKTIVDLQIARLSWLLFDTYFKETIRIVIDNKYIEKVYLDAPKSDRYDEIYNYAIKKMQDILMSEKEYLR